MKKCPRCGAVSPYDQSQCDMCGENLEGIPEESMDAIEQERNLAERQQDALEKATIRRAAERQLISKVAVSVLGVVILLGGLVVLLRYQPLYGFIMMLVGGSMILLGARKPWAFVGGR